MTGRKDRDEDFEARLRKLNREVRSTPKIAKGKGGKAGDDKPKKGGKK